MLVHLHVKNLALIDEIEVEFGPGLNILTGETGAGKSILLGSMQLILGGKTSRSMIRENAPYALVELLFQVENTKAKEALAALDIYPEDGQILMSRKIMDGRSINKINGETSTVSQMKAAAACLLDIHGQHEHQSLLYEEKQLEILDAYGREKIFPEKEKVKAAYQEYKKCQAVYKRGFIIFGVVSLTMGNSCFPPCHSLPCYPQLLCQHFLGHAFFFPGGCNFFSQCHGAIPLSLGPA